MSSRRRLRPQVEQRDHGICSECGLDCERLKNCYLAAELTDESHPYFVCPRCDESRTESGPCPACDWKQMVRKTSRDARSVVEQELAERGYSIPWIMALRRSGARGMHKWWEADHVVPLKEAGDDSLANLVTLCWPHHQQKSAGQANRRKHANTAKRRRDRKRHRKDCRKLSWLNDGPCTCGAVERHIV